MAPRSRQEWLYNKNPGSIQQMYANFADPHTLSVIGDESAENIFKFMEI